MVWRCWRTFRIWEPGSSPVSAVLHSPWSDQGDVGKARAFKSKLQILWSAVSKQRKPRIIPRLSSEFLFTDAQFVDERPVTIYVDVFQIIQETTSPADEL